MNVPTFDLQEWGVGSRESGVGNEASYIYRSKAKSGTCSFYAYATLYVIKKNKRVTLAIKAPNPFGQRAIQGISSPKQSIVF